MYKQLKEVWDATPDPLKKADYCFYVGTGWKNVPSEYKGIEVIVVYVIKPYEIYYAPNGLLKKR